MSKHEIVYFCQERQDARLSIKVNFLSVPIETSCKMFKIFNRMNGVNKHKWFNFDPIVICIYIIELTADLCQYLYEVESRKYAHFCCMSTELRKISLMGFETPLINKMSMAQ